MFRSIGTTILTGVMTVLPIVLTIYLLYWLAVSSEQVMGDLLKWIFPGLQYFPGLGTITGLILIFLIGLLMKAVLIRQLFDFGEKILYKLPIVKSIYRAIREMADFFSPNKDDSFGRVVTVSLGGVEVIGMITQEDPDKLPEAFQKPDHVLVYIPMSYMVGGFTVLVAEENIKPCAMEMDEAMRFALTAGITGKKKSTIVGKGIVT